MPIESRMFYGELDPFVDIQYIKIFLLKILEI